MPHARGLLVCLSSSVSGSRSEGGARERGEGAAAISEVIRETLLKSNAQASRVINWGGGCAVPLLFRGRGGVGGGPHLGAVGQPVRGRAGQDGTYLRNGALSRASTREAASRPPLPSPRTTNKGRYREKRRWFRWRCTSCLRSRPRGRALPGSAGAAEAEADSALRGGGGQVRVARRGAGV